MFVKKDKTYTKPDFVSDGVKWYLDDHFNNYLKQQQADNLPPIEGFGVFIVIGPGIEDYVMVGENQNVVAAFKYNLGGYSQMEARINIIKISKNFDDHESNINV